MVFFILMAFTPSVNSNVSTLAEIIFLWDSKIYLKIKYFFALGTDLLQEIAGLTRTKIPTDPREGYWHCPCSFFPSKHFKSLTSWLLIIYVVSIFLSSTMYILFNKLEHRSKVVRHSLLPSFLLPLKSAASPFGSKKVFLLKEERNEWTP